MVNKLVSVIMSTYNEPLEWIDSSINSILKQSYSNFEFIIICDNPNNKQLIERLNYYKDKDKRITLITNDNNLGLTKSLNKGIEISRGKYIARMDSDDISKENRLLEQVNYLEENSLDLIGSGVVCINEQGKEITKLNRLPKIDSEVKKKIVYNNCLPHPTWFAKREVFEVLQGYRDISYAEDYDFLLRACFKGYKLGNINKILLEYRMRETSISNKNGLKQFITSKALVCAYKQGYLTEYNTVVDKISLLINKLNSNEENQYLVSSKLFSEGVARKNPLKVAKAIVNSKYYREKISCYIRGIL